MNANIAPLEKGMATRKVFGTRADVCGQRTGCARNDYAPEADDDAGVGYGCCVRAPANDDEANNWQNLPITNVNTHCSSKHCCSAYPAGFIAFEQNWSTAPIP